MIQKITHYSFETDDLEEAEKFYSALGFQKRKGFEKEGGKARAIVMAFDNFFFEIWQFNDKSSQYYQIRNHIGAEVANLDDEIKEFESSGSKVIIPIMEGTTVRRYAFLKNPDGQIIELIEPLT